MVKQRVPRLREDVFKSSGAKNDPKGFKALGANMAKAFPHI